MVKTVLRQPGQVLDVLPQPLVLHMVRMLVLDPRMEPLLVQALVLVRVQVPIPALVTMAHPLAQVLVLIPAPVTMEPQHDQVQVLILAPVTLGPQPAQIPEQLPDPAQEHQQGQARVQQHALAQELLLDHLLMTIQREAPEVAVLQQEQEDLKLQLHPMRVEVLHPRIDHHLILQVTAAALLMVPIRPEEVIQAPAVIPEADPIPAVVADVADADNIIA